MSENIKEKIAHLMAMGNDQRTNKFEAEAALRQAAKLMCQHNIDVAELAARSGTKPIYKWVSINVPIFNHKGEPARTGIPWIGVIGASVANFTDTAAAYRLMEEWGVCLRFSGDAIDVEYAVWLFKHLRDSIRSQSKAYGGGTSRNTAFRDAMANRLVERMRTLTEERKEELRKEEFSTGTALVVVQDKIAQRDAHFGRPQYEEVRRKIKHADAAVAGIIAGDKVSINRPMSSDQRRIGS